MKNEYRIRLERLVQRAGLESRYDITFKFVFGAVAAYANGQIFASCGKFGVALKLPGEICASLFDRGLASPLKYFESGHVKKNYVVLGETIRADQKRVTRLTGQSAEFVQD